MKIVINRCFGGFSVSTAAILRLRELGSIEAKEIPVLPNETFPDGSAALSIGALDMHFLRKTERHDPLLAQVVEELGDGASGSLAKLKVVEIPDGTKYEIDEYDGMETVSEIHATWS